MHGEPPKMHAKWRREKKKIGNASEQRRRRRQDPKKIEKNSKKISRDINCDDIIRQRGAQN